MLTIRKTLANASNLSYNYVEKMQFKKDGKHFLKSLAAELGLVKGTFDISYNEGGIAVSGECTLAAESIYVQLSEWCGSHGISILYRSCKGRKDYTGGPNNWTTIDKLANRGDSTPQRAFFIEHLKRLGNLV